MGQETENYVFPLNTTMQLYCLSQEGGVWKFSMTLTLGHWQSQSTVRTERALCPDSCSWLYFISLYSLPFPPVPPFQSSLITCICMVSTDTRLQYYKAMWFWLWAANPVLKQMLSRTPSRLPKLSVKHISWQLAMVAWCMQYMPRSREP